MRRINFEIVVDGDDPLFAISKEDFKQFREFESLPVVPDGSNGPVMAPRSAPKPKAASKSTPKPKTKSTAKAATPQAVTNANPVTKKRKPQQSNRVSSESSVQPSSTKRASRR